MEDCGNCKHIRKEIKHYPSMDGQITICDKYNTQLYYYGDDGGCKKCKECESDNSNKNKKEIKNMKYVCSICGKEYENLNDYLNCVVSCGEKAKKAEAEKEAEEKRIKEQKHLEEINAALNGVKEAKIYYEAKLDEFKQKYPTEYEMNFGKKKESSVKTNDVNDVNKINKNDVKNIEIDFVKNNNEDPVIKASINGNEIPEKEIDEELDKLLGSPEVDWFAKMLGLM